MKDDLFILYYMANDPSQGTGDFLKNPFEKEEGIPIGQLFFWLKGAWAENGGKLKCRIESLYQELGVKSIKKEGSQVARPFQSIEELRRYSYLFCQKVECQRVFLLAVDEFNEVLKFCSTREEVVQKLKVSSDKLENLDLQQSKSFLIEFCLASNIKSNA